MGDKNIMPIKHSFATSKQAKNNIRIREALGKAGVRQWELAEIMGVREERLSKMLRHELPTEQQNELLTLIEVLGNMEDR